MIKIRLQRGGRKRMPIYTIVATDARNPRDGRFIEKLGQYNPTAENVLIDIKTEAVKKWIDRGAVVTDTVKSLFKKENVQL